MYSARRRGASGTPLKPGMLVMSTTYDLPPLCTTVTPKRSIPSAAPQRRVMSTSSGSGVNGWPSFSRWVRAGQLEDAQLDDPVAQRGRGGIRVEQRGARRVERGGDAHREVAFVFEDVEIVVDADPRQLDQLVTEMHRLGGGAPPGE